MDLFGLRSSSKVTETNDDGTTTRRNNTTATATPAVPAARCSWANTAS